MNAIAAITTLQWPLTESTVLGWNDGSITAPKLAVITDYCRALPDGPGGVTAGASMNKKAKIANLLAFLQKQTGDVGSRSWQPVQGPG
jgi:hypothetical protein